MNKTFVNIFMTLLSTLAISCGGILLYIISSVMGIKSPELVVFVVLTVALALEYKGKILKYNDVG